MSLSVANTTFSGASRVKRRMAKKESNPQAATLVDSNTELKVACVSIDEPVILLVT
jgi:hypothetical protein